MAETKPKVREYDINLHLKIDPHSDDAKNINFSSDVPKDVTLTGLPACAVLTFIQLMVEMQQASHD